MSFNAHILDVRDKSVVTTLDMIRIKLMEKVQKRRDLIINYIGLLSPKTQKILEKNKEDATSWIPRWNGNDKFEVVGPYGEQLCLDVKEMKKFGWAKDAR